MRIKKVLLEDHLSKHDGVLVRGGGSGRLVHLQVELDTEEYFDNANNSQHKVED